MSKPGYKPCDLFNSISLIGWNYSWRNNFPPMSTLKFIKGHMVLTWIILKSYRRQPPYTNSLVNTDLIYWKVGSSRLSWLVAHQSIFRLFMTGKFDAYVLVTFGPKFPKLNSRLAYSIISSFDSSWLVAKNLSSFESLENSTTDIAILCRTQNYHLNSNTWQCAVPATIVARLWQ